MTTNRASRQSRWTWNETESKYEGMSPDSEKTPAAGPPPLPPPESASAATPPAEPPAFDPSSAPPPPLPPGSQGPSFMDRVKPVVKPWRDAAWLHLQVWIPFLANPQLRARQVKYRA